MVDHLFSDYIDGLRIDGDVSVSKTFLHQFRFSVMNSPNKQLDLTITFFCHFPNCRVQNRYERSLQVAFFSFFCTF